MQRVAVSTEAESNLWITHKSLANLLSYSGTARLNSSYRTIIRVSHSACPVFVARVQVHIQLATWLLFCFIIFLYPVFLYVPLS